MPHEVLGSVTHSGDPGSEAARQLEALFHTYGAERIFLVAGRHSWDLSGAAQALGALLAQRRLVRFSDFSPNPDLAEVERGLALYRSDPFDLVLAVGGGSTIDLAKLINSIGANEGPASDLITGAATLVTPGLPLVAVPTTAGSGAEATHFAAVYIDGSKHSMTHESMRPTHSILDFSLTLSLPPFTTAATGMDALSQGIEAYWSVRSTPESRAHSAQAIELCASALVDATNHPSGSVREKMLRGAHLAGKAIDIAHTTAPHALSYALTGGFGVTHGHAVALTLGVIFAFNAEAGDDDTIDPRGAGHLHARIEELCAMLGCHNAAEARGVLGSLMEKTGLASRLRDVGVSRADLPMLVSTVNEQRLKNNPRRLSAKIIGSLLDEIY